MENYSNHSYPDSRESSPRSREIDCDTPSWDDQPQSQPAYKVKFMCSYGGKIQPRPHDNQLAYVGGDTKILAVDRNIKLSAFVSRLSSLCESDAVCFKYQLPGEDLDALISVTNDEDLDHMMIEYDRLYRASPKPARLRLFLFPLNNSNNSFGSNDSKSDRQWFVDALNSVQIQSPEGSSPTAPPSAASANPDFLFGFDKVSAAPEKTAHAHAQALPGSDGDRVGPDPAVISQLEIQRQIQELHRMQIAAGHEPTIYNRKIIDEVPNPRAYTGDYYTQKLPEAPVQGAPVQPVQVPMPPQMQMQYQTGYLPERQLNPGSYQVAAAPAAAEQQQQQQPMYLISTPAGVYQAPAGHRPATGPVPVGQAYYGVPQRMMQPQQEVYRDQAQVYNTAVAAQQQQQQAKVAAAYSEGFAQVGYDNAGRQVYYTTAGGGGVASAYQAVAAAPVAVDARQAGGGGAINQIQDGKVVVSVPAQASAN